METHLADFIRDTPQGREAEAILRRCVHCGFCTATCPTYQLFGDELDGPRGRIYLIKQVLEGAPAGEKTRLHLDRCLTCRSCETTCPSGVEYVKLLDIGRHVVAAQLPRQGSDALQRTLLKAVAPRPAVFAAALKLGEIARPLLPAALRGKIPQRAPRVASAARPTLDQAKQTHSRRMITLGGCVQPTLQPNIVAAATRVLDRLGIALIAADSGHAQAGCCGALHYHLDDVENARQAARSNIDAWQPLLDAGAEGLVMTASGCGLHVRDYVNLLEDDARYATKAARIALLTRDIAEAVAAEQEKLLPLLRACPPLPEKDRPVAFHSPCTLQHGLKIRGTVETLLTAAGYQVQAIADAHLCCGSAGSYSILQPGIARQLRDNKLATLTAAAPATIASANIGCITHLQSGVDLPVKHWIELIDRRLADPSPE